MTDIGQHDQVSARDGGMERLSDAEGRAGVRVTVEHESRHHDGREHASKVGLCERSRQGRKRVRVKPRTDRQHLLDEVRRGGR